MTTRKYLGIALLLAMSINGYASDKPIAIAGAGAIGCKEWTDLRDRKSKVIDNVLITWLQGFLSGMNIQKYSLSKDDFVLIPRPDAMLEYIDTACGKNSKEEVVSVSIDLFNSLQRK